MNFHIIQAGAKIGVVQHAAAEPVRLSLGHGPYVGQTMLERREIGIAAHELEQM